jgi:hypothetical protein
VSTKTIWLDAPDIEQRSWLLRDGTIVTTPPIERTATNKRLRIKGTTTSIGIRQLDKLVFEAMRKVADDKGTELWMSVQTPEASRAMATSHVSVSHAIWQEALSLHLLQDRSTNQARRENNKSVAVWTYKAQNLPLYAYVFVELQSNHGGSIFVNTRVVHRTTHPRDNESGGAFMAAFTNEAWQRLAYNVGYHGAEYDAVEAFESSGAHPFGPQTDDRIDCRNRNFGSQPRKAVTFMLNQCEAVNQVPSIELPDFRDALNPTTHTFEFLETNYSGSFAQELRDFQQTGPIMDRIKEHYRELLADLELLGVVLPERPEDTAFEKAISGDFTELAVGIRPVDLEDDGDSLDSQHIIYMNFPSGTITVSCRHPGHPDAKAQWEIDRFKFEATGELSELMAYARAFHAKPDRKKAKKIANERIFDSDK